MDSILAEDSKHGSPANQSPLDITILCTDLSLFCDTNTDSHKAAVRRFSIHVSPFFQKSLLNSIRIVTASSGEVALLLDDDVQREHNRPNDEDEDTTMGSSDGVKISKVVQKNQDSVSKCVDVIEATLDEFVFAGLSRHKLAADGAGGNPFSVSYSVIDSTFLGFKYLSREWIRDSLRGEFSGRIQFDLPATVGGTQCSVALNAAYQTFPFAVDSLQAKFLGWDMVFLSNLDIRVSQIIPLSSVDVSLLFGVPITVTPFGDDYTQFQEMEILARALFRVLQEQQVAILLRGTANDLIDGVHPQKSSCGLFQSHEQLFILMAQELPTSVGLIPSSGLLFRIAHADQLLGEATYSTVKVGREKTGAEGDKEAQYFELVEESFAALQLSPFNPLDLASQPMIHHDRSLKFRYTGESVSVCTAVPGYDNELNLLSVVHDSSMGDGYAGSDSSPRSCSSVWNDASGVGASGPPPTQEEGLEEEDAPQLPALGEDL